MMLACGSRGSTRCAGRGDYSAAAVHRRALMASKRRLRRQAAKVCDGKLRFRGHVDAETAIEDMGDLADANTHAYRCRHCGSWHIGHSQANQVRRIRKGIGR